MESGTVLAVAKRLRSLHRRLLRIAPRQGDATPLISEESELVDLLVARLKDRQDAVVACSHALADRLNNMLMGVQTIADQLRQGQDENGIAGLRRRLDEIVQRGRESLKALRDAVAELE